MPEDVERYGSDARAFQFIVVHYNVVCFPSNLRSFKSLFFVCLFVFFMHRLANTYI